MKKLLLSTALTGVLITTSAIAQTSVTGNMTIGLRSTSEKGALGATATSSKRGMLAETQLNVQNKGKLNNGDVHSEEYQQMRDRISKLEFDLNVVNQLIHKGHA